MRHNKHYTFAQKLVGQLFRDLVGNLQPIFFSPLKNNAERNNSQNYICVRRLISMLRWAKSCLQIIAAGKQCLKNQGLLKTMKLAVNLQTFKKRLSQRQSQTKMCYKVHSLNLQTSIFIILGIILDMVIFHKIIFFNCFGF